MALRYLRKDPEANPIIIFVKAQNEKKSELFS